MIAPAVAREHAHTLRRDAAIRPKPPRVVQIAISRADINPAIALAAERIWAALYEEAQP